jgi:hypothetical protein
LIFTFYESLARGIAWVGGGDTFTGAGIDGDESVFRDCGLFLFEDSHAMGSAFGVGVIAPSVADRAIGSAFGFLVLISCFLFASYCSGFSKFFFTSEAQSESSAFGPAISHCTPQLSRSCSPSLSQRRDI